MTRASGMSVPLFSIPTTRSWGIGEFPDVVAFARWAAGAGQSLVQILPVMELPGHERSPYSALSSFALDPMYLALPRVPDFEAIGGEEALSADDRRTLADVRQARRVPSDGVRRLKWPWLGRAWAHFARVELAGQTPRAQAFEAFCAREAWWLDDYALFRAVLDQESQRPWWAWPEPLRRVNADAIARARVELQAEIAYRKYLQWLAAEQWAEARRQARPMRLFGDLPFMITGNSADVWVRQREFRLDATVGAPPDAFSEDGQDWGLPPWRWRVMRQGGYEWFRARARRHAELFDGFRIDHLVGLYRAWTRPVYKAQPPFFDPAVEPEQLALGEDLVGIFKSAGADVFAEDLGTVPPFVRRSLTALGVPGFKVLQWERRWDEPGQPPIDPKTFPPLSVATTGTHDIEPLAATLSTQDVRQAVETLIDSGSDLSLLPLQDAFGWPDRINTPSVVDDLNWTWRVPRPVDEWGQWAEARDRQQWLRELTRRAGR
jgi:4-alpha-glucanotransferase